MVTPSVAHADATAENSAAGTTTPIEVTTTYFRSNAPSANSVEQKQQQMAGLNLSPSAGTPQSATAQADVTLSYYGGPCGSNAVSYGLLPPELTVNEGVMECATSEAQSVP